MKSTVILLALLSLAACRDDRTDRRPADPRADPLADSAARSVFDDTLGPFEVDAQRFTIHFDKQRAGSDEHVVRLRIVDDSGRVHVEERFDSAAVAASSLEYAITVGATPLRGERGQGLLIWYETLPSAPLSGISVKVFSRVDDRLRALSLPISVYGSFQDLHRDTVTQVERLLRGDVMNVEVRLAWFGVVVPLFVDLGGCAPVAGSSCIRPAPTRHHEASGLAIFDVVGRVTPAGTDTTVVLFDAPEGKSLGRVPVRPASRVSLVEVAAEPVVTSEEGFMDITVRREWLHVRIDGRRGWVNGQESFGAIGLQPAG